MTGGTSNRSVEATPVRWGILSTARINQQAILAPARDSRRARIVAVAARDSARAEAYARDHDIPRAFGSYDELLADPDVDAVYISLPNSLHPEWSIRALEAGKHVLCEKPFSPRAAEVAAAFDAAEANGVLLMEAFMYRHHPQTATVAELVSSGAVGEPRFVRAMLAFPGIRFFDATNIRFDAALEGGALMDVGSYCVSGARLVGGEPVRVHGTAVLGPTGADLAFAGTLEFEGGLLAQFQCGFTSDLRSELEVIGTEGRLVVPQPFRIEEAGVDLWTKDRHRRVACEPANSYQLQLDNFSAAIRGEAAPLLGREDALGQSRTLEALRASAASGRSVIVAD
ncbi:MAG: Gfo/Idh/MocA family oxidoreductase [Chloroflexi bacterium]|nr:Gfo/Idh/MocA family oxidoreductase [Chloroflexota bacterium]